MGNVKIKVFLGYFTMVVMASFTIWIIYSQILGTSGLNSGTSGDGKKIMYINAILTNLYEAEGLGRNYVHTGRLKDHQAYLTLADTISVQINRLAGITDNPGQQQHIDSIKILLHKKQRNMEELSAARKALSSPTRYHQFLERLTATNDSIDSFLQVYQQVITNYDTLLVKQPKKKLLERLAYVFSPNNKDSSFYVSINKTVKLDSLVNNINPADSIKEYFTALIEEIRDENIAMESQLKNKEFAAFNNDLVISAQLRKILSNIENEELLNSFQEIKEHQAKIHKTTWIIIILGGLSLTTIIFFLINILKDLTRSQHYRQSLEAANSFTASLLKNKEQFMLSLTHDLKSPLSSIIGFTGLLEEGGVSSQQMLYLQRIKNASDYILKLINDLVDLARLDTGKLKTDHTPVDLLPLLINTVETFRPQAMQKKLELHCELDITPNTICMSDPKRITQILSNLLSNAIKFTEQGWVTVKAYLQSMNGNNDRLYIEVQDTGIGISKEDSRLIFEEFTRTAETSNKYEGSGLGLAITKKIVTLMHGSVVLESTPGSGSIFKVFLPIERKYNADDLPVKKKDKKPVNTYNLTGEKIWLVDDDPTVLEMVTRVLESAGMEVIPFGDSTQVVSILNKGKADYLLADIRMPEMNGVSLARKVRERWGDDIIIIGMSGQDMEEKDRVYFNGFIIKPFRPATLISLIAEITKGKGCTMPQESVDFVKNNGYTLTNIAAFTGGDTESLKQILVSFINSGMQNIELLEQCLKRHNSKAIAELAHKMLPLYRQLEASDIVNLLEYLERHSDSSVPGKNYYKVGRNAVVEIKQLLITIQEKERIIV